MAKHTYRVASPEGAAFAITQTGAELEEGATVELDLDVDTKRAVVAAGWVDPVEEKEKGGK